MMPQQSAIISLIQSLKQARVLCIGDVILDRFIVGDVERISPEAPIPILQIREENSMIGGAGNVVRNLMTLGAIVRFISVTGNDQAGNKIEDMIDENGNVVADFVIDPKRETSIKTRFLAANQQILRADKETISDISQSCVEKIYSIANKELASYGALVLSDYGKGVLTQN